jgi:hypothetical protein
MLGGQFKPGKGFIYGHTYVGRMEDTVHIALSKKYISRPVREIKQITLVPFLLKPWRHFKKRSYNLIDQCIRCDLFHLLCEINLPVFCSSHTLLTSKTIREVTPL